MKHTLSLDFHLDSGGPEKKKSSSARALARASANTQRSRKLHDSQILTQLVRRFFEPPFDASGAELLRDLFEPRFDALDADLFRSLL